MTFAFERPVVRRSLVEARLRKVKVSSFYELRDGATTFSREILAAAGHFIPSDPRRIVEGRGTGQLNRLKNAEAPMYGRAAIELLRVRLLPEPAFGDPYIAPKLVRTEWVAVLLSLPRSNGALWLSGG